MITRLRREVSRPGHGARSHRRAAALMVAAAALLATFVLTAQPASAKSVEGLHSFLYSIKPADVGISGYGWNVTGVAVDNSSGPEAGKLYVGANGYDKISRLTPGAGSAIFDCLISGAGGSSTDPNECAAAGPALPAGRFSGMFGVAVDPSNGDVYAVDTVFSSPPHIIAMFNPAGELVKSLDLGESNTIFPNRVAAAPGVLYIANEGSAGNAIEKWEPATETLTTFSTGADAPTGRFGHIVGVTVDLDPSSPSYKDVYAVDQGTNEIQSYTPPPPEIGGIPSEYTLTYEGQTTEPIKGIATPAKVREELEKLSTITKPGEATYKESNASGNVQVTQVGSEYRVEFIHNLRTTNVPSLEAELIEPSHEPIAVTTVTQGVIPALDKLDESGEYQCQITGAGAESTSTSECSKAEPGIIGVSGPRGFNTNGGINGAAAVDPSNGHIYIENRVLYEPSTGGSGGPIGIFNHLYIDEFNAKGDFIAAIEESPEYQLDAYNIGVSASNHDLFLTNLGQFRVDVFGGDKPMLRTGTASEAKGTSAVLHGSVNPLGFPVEECKFEYVEAAKWKPKSTEPYAAGTSVPCEGAAGSDETFHSVEAHITGLEANKFYYFRLAARNANGTAEGTDEAFGAPYAGTYVATEVEQTAAKLNGVVNPNNGEAHYYFEYGTDTSYGSKAPVSPNGPLTGKDEQLVSQALSGLDNGTTYHYRLVATDASGTTYGRDHNFTTPPAALIDAISARHQTTDSAVLQAYIDPLGAATTYHFEYGTSTEYGHTTPTESAGSGSEAVNEEAHVAGLQPGTEYHFRTVATNVNGTVTGPDQVFLTESEHCANEARRQEQGNPGMMLPDCRAFERVSPEEKGGAPAGGDELAANGEYVLYTSVGLFAGNEWPETPFMGGPYLAHRTPKGWVSEAIHPTIKQVPLFHAGFMVSASPDLSETFWTEYGNNLSSFEEPTGTAVFRRSSDGSFTQVSPDLKAFGVPWRSIEPRGENTALTHMVFGSTEPLIPSDPYPANQNRLYDVTLGGNPGISLINVTSEGTAIPNCGELYGSGVPLYFGGQSVGPNGATNAITPDGSHIFFQMVPQGPQGEDCHPEGFGRIDFQLFARVAQSQTVSISEPESNEECLTMRCLTSPAQDTRFDGASEDGSKVFFLNTHPLTDEGAEDTLETDAADTCDDNGVYGIIQGPNGCNLYMYDFNRAEGHNLVDISGGVPEATKETPHSASFGPQVKYVLRSSPDGSHVYFIARGLLTDTPNSLGERAQQGAENLYYFNTETEEMRYIGELCNGFERSGGIPDPKCSGDDHAMLIEPSSPQFTNANGTILVFETYSQITPDDNNAATDIYRYDSNTGAIERISIGHNGEDDQNGNAGGGAKLMPTGSCQGQPYATCRPDSSIHERPMTNDGSMIVFDTSRPLEEGDNNEHEDFYEWRDGQVSLISGAKSRIPITQIGGLLLGGSNPVISADGRDITFATDTNLVEEDKDKGLGDVYDARIGGGFKPESSTVAEPCHGSETCAGQLQTPPESPRFGSETFAAPPQSVQCHKGFVQKHHHCVRRVAHHRRRHRKHRQRGRHHRRASAHREGRR